MFKKMAIAIVATLVATVATITTTQGAASAQQSVESCDTASADVLRLYVAMFNRSYDTDGGIYWQTQNQAGISLDDIALAMSQGPEFQTAYGNITSDEDFVTKVYRNVFKRNPDAAGLNYWVSQMDAGLDEHLLVRWMSQSQELRLRYNYEASCSNSVAAPVAAAVDNEDGLTEISGPYDQTLNATTEFIVTTQYQALPGNSTCELYTLNDSSISTSTADSWVSILNNYGQEHVYDLEQSAGYEYRHMFSTPTEPWAEKGILTSQDSSFALATVSCTSN